MRNRFIPDNVLSGKRICGFKPANLKEGVIEVIIFSFIIFQIPFILKVKWIIIICCGIAIMAANYIGIAGNSYFQTLFNFLNYRKNLKQYSFRRMQHGLTKKKQLIVNGKVKTIKENRTSNFLKKVIGK